MKPLFVLLSAFLATIAIQQMLFGHFSYKLSGRLAMSFMLIFTAIGHFAFSDGMTLMLPDYLPYKHEGIILSGIFEILLAVLLFFPQLNIPIGWIIIVFFIILLPFNIIGAANNINIEQATYDGPGLSYLWFRVPLQLFFIIWTYISTIKP